MQCIATEAGYDNVKVREPGESFEWPDGQPIPDWAEAIDESGQGVPRTDKQKKVAKGVLAQDLS